MQRNLTLLTDLYEITMMNGYFAQGKANQTVVFDVFFRQNQLITYSVTAGLEQVVDYLQDLHFSAEDIEYLRSLNLFGAEFLDYLKTFKFTGDVFAMPEGTVVFPGEPILTIRSNIIEAQLVETAILNIINHQTLIASKAAKVCYSAKGDLVMEFGLRRAQGPDAGIYGARASIIGGCNSTSNVLAGQMFGLQVAGTHAHSWVMNFPTELDAFRAYANTYPNCVLLLVDTYDTLKSGVPNAIKVFKECEEKGIKPVGIRLDSGDLAYLTKKARKMLDDAGFDYVKICASGDLDEYSINSLKNQGAKIDSWGIGTKLITSQQMPSLGGVYKLAGVYEGDKIIPKIKLSDNSAKITNPGFKTVYRIYDEQNMACCDLIALRSETFDQTKPLTVFHPVETWRKMTFEAGKYTMRELVKPVMANGALVEKMPTLDQICKYAESERATFWDEYKRLDQPQVYKVDLSDGLYELKTNLINQIRKG